MLIHKLYHKKGHEIDFQSGKEYEQSFFNTSTGNVTHETPKKQKEKQQENVNAENEFTYVVLPGNHLKIMKLIPFGLDAQGKLENVRVLLPLSMSATGGCITGV